MARRLDANLTVLWEAAQQLDMGPAILTALLAKVSTPGRHPSRHMPCKLMRSLQETVLMWK